MNKEAEKYIHLLQEKYGVDLSVYDRSFLEKALKSRMAFTLCDTSEKYLNYLDRETGEPTGLLNLLSNSYSEFFRNPLTFSVLEQAVIPRLFDQAAKNNSREIRIWSAGCAAGQEPYSLAMLFTEFQGHHSPEPGFRIFATDVSATELVKAQNGIFDLKTLKNTRIELAEKYFRRKGETFSLDQKIKDLVNFSVYDLLDQDSSSPPSAVFGDFDLVMCSNVLIYYEVESQKLILHKIYRSLKKGGFLITGEAETSLVSNFGGFRQHVPPAAIFIKN